MFLLGKKKCRREEFLKKNKSATFILGSLGYDKVYLSAFLNYTICAIFSTFAPLVTFINWNSRTYSQFSILGIGKVIYIGKLRTTGFFSLEITRFSRTFTAKRWVIRNDNAIRRF